MIYELLHAPFPDGYTEALLPLAECKLHLHVDGTDEDDLIEALRDAAIEFVERYCSVRLGPMEGLVWTAESFPPADSQSLCLGAKPVIEITAISWKDSAGAAVTGTVGDFRVTTHGEVLPAIGESWPGNVGGGIRITFTAGYEDGEAPKSLLAAARMLLGHLHANREAVIAGSITAEIPFGVQALCRSFRRVLI